MIEGTIRKDIKVGTKVMIVQKQHQRTGELTEGIVRDILTNSSNHPRGIKVRLESGLSRKSTKNSRIKLILAKDDVIHNIFPAYKTDTCF